MKVKPRKLILIFVIIALFFIPFLWFKPGEMDLGGDSSRLYFFDPGNYLNSSPFYLTAPNGVGTYWSVTFEIPYIAFLMGLKFFLQSSYLLITLFNSFSLIVAFVSIYSIVLYLIIKENSSEEEKNIISVVAIVSGIFYVLSPILIHGGWDRALFNHNLFFINPLIFNLLLLYFLKRNKLYALSALIISFIFAPSFFPSPYFFSFFPFSLLFLFLYITQVKKIVIKKKEVIVLFLLFIGIHLFQTLPFVLLTLSNGSTYNIAAFSDAGKFDRGLGAFIAVVDLARIPNNLIGFNNEKISGIGFLWIIFPFLLTLGLIFSNLQKDKEKTKTFLLLVVFFLISFFFFSAKVNFIGLEIYKWLFNIPGFGMFRYFSGHFNHVYIFFYSIAIGFALFYIFSFVKSKLKFWAVVGVILLLITITAIPFIRGETVNFTFLSTNSRHAFKIPIIMDPQYEKALTYVRSLPDSSKFLSLPLNDHGYQILQGTNGGAYLGPPSIAYLAGKGEFSGLAMQFGNEFGIFTRDKDYDSIKKILTLLNVKYIFYNSDPAIYNLEFNTWPYDFIKKFMPKDQTTYLQFINQLGFTKVADFGKYYHIYKANSENFLPQIFIAKKEVIAAVSSDTLIKILPLYKQELRTIIFPQENLEKNAKNTDVILNPQVEGELYSQYNPNNLIQITAPISVDFYRLIHPFYEIENQRNAFNKSSIFDTDFDKKVNVSKEFIISLENSNKWIVLEELKQESDLDKKNFYNKTSWESHLIGYYTTMKQLIEDSKIHQKNSFADPLMNQIKLRRYLIADENKINWIVNDKKLSQNQKEYLIAISDSIFKKLQSMLFSEKQRELRSTYPVSSSNKDTYEVLISRTGIEKLAQNKLTAQVNNNMLKKYGEDEKWIQFSTVLIDPGSTIKTVIPGYPEFINYSFFGNNQKSNFPQDTVLMKYPVLVDYAKWMIGNYLGLNDIKYHNPYIISFEYNVDSTGKFEENGWRKYTVAVEFDDKSNSAIFKFLTDEKEKGVIPDFFDTKSIRVRNVSIVAFDSPDILLRKRQAQETTQKNPPQVSFSKINPTKYKIEVTNAESLYTLVFQDAFNAHWKVYRVDKSNMGDSLLDRVAHIFGSVGSIVIGTLFPNNSAAEIEESYFNNEIIEYSRKNAFLDAQTFETWGQKSLAENRHFLVNGYANAWVIKPQDVDNKKNYTLILEFAPQRSFLGLFFISLVFFTVLVIWTGWLFYKLIIKRKR